MIRFAWEKKVWLFVGVMEIYLISSLVLSLVEKN